MSNNGNPDPVGESACFLVRIVRLFAIENAHHSSEVLSGLLTKVIGPRITDIVLGDRVGNRAELLTRRLSEDLHFAGALEEIEVVEAARHGLARNDHAMIRVEEDVALPERSGETLPFAGVVGGASIDVVIGDAPMKPQGVLTDRQEPAAFENANRRRMSLMRVKHANAVWTGSEDARMNEQRRRLDLPFPFEQMPIAIDDEKAARADFRPVEAVGDHEEAFRFPWHA